MNRLNYISSLCLLVACFFSQFTLHAQKVSSNAAPYLVKGDFVQFRLDDFNNIYTLDQAQLLKKYNKDLTEVFSYSFLRQGDISDIEVNNPTKLMLFFSDYQIVVFLDNTLSEINRLELEDLGLWNITSVTQSPDNHLWLYDPVNFRILKINESGKTIYSSNEFYFGKLSNAIQPRLTANLNYTICYTDSEYMIFTNFGDLYRSSRISSDKIILKNAYLFILDGHKIILEPIRPEITSGPEIVFTSEKQIRDFQISKNGILYILDDTGIKSVNIN